VEVDAPDVMVMGSTKDMLDRGHFFDRDWQPHDFEDRSEFSQWQEDQKSPEGSSYAQTDSEG
jgi:hypothetical protein